MRLWFYKFKYIPNSLKLLQSKIISNYIKITLSFFGQAHIKSSREHIKIAYKITETFRCQRWEINREASY